MKYFMESVKIKVFLGYFTLVVLSSLIIWVIYSEILKNSAERVDLNPANNKFIYINNIVTNLYQAEGLERSYVLTGQKIFYLDYLKLMNTIYLQIDTLALLVNNPVQQIHTDSIKKLLNAKWQNLKELDVIKKGNSSTIRYQEAIKKLAAVKDSVEEPRIVYKNTITDRDSIYLKQKKKKFFERLANVFATQNKPDSNLHVRSTQSIQIDSLVNNGNPADTIASSIAAIVTEMRDKNLAVETRLKQKELEILATDLTIMFQLRQMLSNIEIDELNNSFLKVKVQQNRIEKATWQIILVGSFALVIIIFFLVNILKDITKSQHYRQNLETAKAYSESLLKSKEQFMLSLTHDLKSPLNSIIGFSELLEGDHDVSPRNRKYLQNINNASEYILKLVNNLLDLARLESGKLPIECLPFGLKPLIDDVVEGFRPRAQARNINLHIQSNTTPSAIYRSDPVRIRQILSNLISNALKFTEEGTVMVKVSVIGSSGKTDQIRIDVIDTGIGISAENIQHIFGEFERVPTARKQYEGAGLGLAITQKLIKLLQGTIKLESKLGEGSHFTVVLPLEKSVQVAENAGEIIAGKDKEAKEDLAGKRVWIIDDDETLLEMISAILRSEGMEVQSFCDPKKAILSFTKGCADLLIMDIQMPEINGVELLEQIQAKNGGKITSIAISGMIVGQNGYPGFSAFIPKPFHPKTLIDVISGKQKEIPVTDNRDASVDTPRKSYNLEQFVAFAAGDPESLSQILISLIQTGKENTSNFRRYLQEENVDAISALSHRMLTLFRQMEATEIVELLIRLEHTDFARQDANQYFICGRLALEKIEALLRVIQISENIEVG